MMMIGLEKEGPTKGGMSLEIRPWALIRGVKYRRLMKGLARRKPRSLQ